jgi:hypothetical protein
VKRIVVVISSVIALIALSVTLGGAAWSAADTSSTAVITFDDAAQQATLTIPTPACPASQPDCRWKFFMNEPKLNVDVATVYGTSGTLTIAYPPDFCGVIQADAYIGGPPWDAKRGFQHTIEDCKPPPTTTTTEPPTTTTTAMPAPPTTTPPPPPPVAQGPHAPPPPPAPAPPPATAASPTPVASPATIPAAAAPTQLPFTGVDVKPLWFIGLTLVALGVGLLTSGESWRRMARRLLTTMGYWLI